MASSTSSSSPSPPTFLHRPLQFTPIQECEREDQDDDQYSVISEKKATPSRFADKRLTPKHQQRNLTPLHEKTTKAIKKPRHREDHDGSSSVSCNNCRPNSREKISVVPLDHNSNGLKHSSSMPSPNGLLKSIFSSLTRKSPKSSSSGLDHFSASREEQWKITIGELSHKLIQATRKRDEAVLEASRLKHSMSELEKKLNKLELYCHNLKSGLDECSGNSPYQSKIFNGGSNHSGGSVSERVIEQFLVSVSEARSSVRQISRALTMQMRHMGGRVYERVSLLLQPYDIKISFPRNPKCILFYLEALLNKALFEDFESVGFKKSSCNQILNPIDRCEANYAKYNVLKELTWEEVLSRGTRHFSEEFSKFCDRKMNDIVAMLGWNRAWPEQLLQAFFYAAKSAWLVHALANSVHPGLVIFRVDKEARFDSIYMEDMGGDRAQSLVPTVVRIMVAPGFYVYGNVVKCKVLCRYYNSNNMSTISTYNDKILLQTP